MRHIPLGLSQVVETNRICKVQLDCSHSGRLHGSLIDYCRIGPPFLAARSVSSFRMIGARGSIISSCLGRGWQCQSPEAVVGSGRRGNGREEILCTMVDTSRAKHSWTIWSGGGAIRAAFLPKGVHCEKKEDAVGQKCFSKYCI